ncbi:cupin domain-containing protein [uncultured Oscillibacter sp.]|uniref:cupin domain-containing protein n=1 Tax=uncultured Oscillibacter sp. TaxID=876091 RepID=UPI0025E0A0EE|nr:cupin domain-containing protein [uncultured Oscillibacter sp.]
MVALKNIQPEQVLSLAGQVTAQPGQIVSRTLVQTSAVSLTLFAFSKGEEISTHESQGDALVQVLEGVGRFTVDGTDYVCRAGESLVTPAQKPHAVYGEEAFKMLLTVVFPPEAQ